MLSLLQAFCTKYNITGEAPLPRQGSPLPMFAQTSIDSHIAVQFYVRNGFRNKYLDKFKEQELYNNEGQPKEPDDIINFDILHCLPEDMKRSVAALDDIDDNQNISDDIRKILQEPQEINSDNRLVSAVGTTRRVMLYLLTKGQKDFPMVLFVLEDWMDKYVNKVEDVEFTYGLEN